MKQQIVKLGKVAITVDKNYWTITKDYDRLVMVKRQSTGVVYISRKPVPAGIEITNRDYWLSFNIDGADSTTVVNLVQEFGDDIEVAISQKVITEKIEEIEAAIASIDSNSGGHNILPFDGFLTVPVSNVSNEKYTYHRTISPNQIIISPLNYTIVANLNSPNKFYLKVEGTNGEEDTYYSKWEITTDVYGNGNTSPGDPFTTLEPGVVSKSEWYYREYRINKLFYNRSNKVVYAYEYDTTSLIPITNIQVVETNAPEEESTSNPDNATKGSIVVDLEHDKLLTWDGNKWKALSGGGSTPVDVPNSIDIRNRVLYLEKVSTGSEPVVFASVELPAGGGQTVLVQSSEDSPSIVRLNTDTSKLGKKVIPLGTSAANLFKNGVRENDSDVYDQTTYSTDDGTYTIYHIKYEFDLNNSSITVPEKSILKFEGGCLKNGTLVGNNTKVEVDGTYTIFDNMSFSGTFRDSNLYATNFGAIGNMVSVSKTLTYKNLVDEPIKERTRLVNGVDELNLNTGSGGLESHDYKAFTSFRRFVDGSNNIKLTLNGDFYVAKVRSDLLGYSTELYIERANNLTIEGGTTTVGWRFSGCNNVTLANTKYVGYHEIHKFPYIAADITGTYNNGANNYSDIMVKYIGDYEMSKFGVAEGIYFYSASIITQSNKDTFIAPNGFHMDNCLVEMRAAGIYLGLASKDGNNVNGLRVADGCVIENCKIQYIKSQAFSLHGARGAKIRNCTIDYCNCPIDWSTGSTNCVIENIVATRCGMGYKHETDAYASDIYYCGNNIGRNIIVTIDDAFPYKRGAEEYFALKVNQASAGDVFRLYDCTFNIDRTETSVGNKGKSLIEFAIKISGNVIFNNCLFDISKTFGLCGNKDATDNSTRYDVTFSNSTLIVRNGLSANGWLFKGINTLSIDDSKVELKNYNGTANAFNFATVIAETYIEDSTINIERSSTMSLGLSDNITIKNNRISFNAYGNAYGHGFKLPSNAVIENNTILFSSSDTKSLFVVGSVIESLRLNNNTIITNSGVIFTDSGRIDEVEVKNNIIDYTHTGSLTTGYRSILNLKNSTGITIDSNIFKGSDSREVSDVITHGSRLVGNLIDIMSKNVIDNLPDASTAGFGYVYRDTTGDRFLTSDGNDWYDNKGEKIVVLPKSGASENIPQSAPLGTAYFDTDNNVMKVYNGSQWVNSEQRIIPNSTGTIDAALPQGYILNNTNTNTIQFKLVGAGGNAWIDIPLTNGCLVVSGSGSYNDFDRTDYTQSTQIYYATDLDRYCLWYPGEGSSHTNAGLYILPKNRVALSSGTFNNAPDINEVVLGYTYYDTVRQKLLTAKSEGWTDNEGNVITVLTKGTTVQRPATTDITEGFKYYNTESHKEQIYNGTTWIDIEDAASAGTRVDSLVPDIVVGTTSALSTTLAAAINKYYRYDTAVDELTVTLPELVSSSKVQNVVVYLTAGSNADSTTITFAAATPTEGTAAPVYYQKSYDIEAGKTYEINALYNGAAWIVAAVEIVTAVAQSSNSNSNSLLMGGFTPADTNDTNSDTTDVQPENTEDI